MSCFGASFLVTVNALLLGGQQQKGPRTPSLAFGSHSTFEGEVRNVPVAVLKIIRAATVNISLFVGGRWPMH